MGKTEMQIMARDYIDICFQTVQEYIVGYNNGKYDAELVDLGLTRISNAISAYSAIELFSGSEILEFYARCDLIRDNFEKEM
nr:hypothetical protein [uncultured Ruminococcus sp.]